MTDIAAFIASRLDEDEAVALAVEGHQLFDGTGIIVMRTHEGLHDRSITLPSHVATYAARHDPARVLAEVAAKRRRLERHDTTTSDGIFCCSCEHQWPCPDVLDDAAIWFDHPDYDPAWRIDA